MEQNNTKGDIENNAVEAEGAETFEESSKREKVDCSHRVIEKRRRDRINNSLLQLSKLVPIEKFNKKNNGKLEKAEILEVTVNYLTQQKFKKEQEESSTQTLDDDATQGSHEASKNQQQIDLNVFLNGFKQCISDATKFFQDIEELDVSEGRCYRLIQHLKRQTNRYETKERDLSKFGGGERVVWDAEGTSTGSGCRIVKDSSPNKRNNGDNLEEIATTCKKSRPSNESNGKPEQTSSAEQVCLTSSTVAASNSETSRNADPSVNYMPFVFPNMPLFTTLPFTGSNNMPRFQPPSSQYPSYPYQPSPQYIPFAFPQFPVMGMNFMPGFGVVNGEQNQNGSMNATVPNALPMHSGVPNQANLNLMPPGISNGFFPSMYTNGLHANILSMRPRDSGYESSEKSSSSKASGSGTSPQSFSDDSCQSYTA